MHVVCKSFKVPQFVKNHFKVLPKQPFVGLDQFSKEMIEK